MIGESGGHHKISDVTSQTKAFPAYNGLSKSNANDCSAYVLRFGKVNVGNNTKTSSYVTSG